MAIDPKCKPGANIDFGEPGSATLASVCGIDFTIPTFAVPPAISIPFQFPPPFPFPKLNFKLSCDPNDPIDISAGLENGGGRIACLDEDPDLQEAA